ncbi:MAG: methyltransferase domain-containing protein [Bryobacteraceae bacterium]|nr:methyltransferase domain-containing protein [Bryobacteraceae bacterium]
MKMFAFRCLFALLVLAALPVYGQRIKPEPRNLAPFVTSPVPVIERMLMIADLKPGETLFDLGCGDGRILVAAADKFKAKAIGVELNERYANMARENLRKANLTDAKVLQGNMLEADISSADVVTLYLLTMSNDLLRPKLEQQLKPGARVVSLDYQIRGWKPSRVEKTEAHHRRYTMYLYEIGKQR